jgi:hypothetical protein
MATAQSGAARGHSVGHESIDGTLSGSVLQFNLAGELDQLHRDEAWLPPTGRSSKTLVKYPDLRIVLIAMKANTRMHEHTAAGRISVHTLNGHIRLHLPERVVDLPAGNLLAWISAFLMMWRPPRTAPFCSRSRGRGKRRLWRQERAGERLPDMNGNSGKSLVRVVAVLPGALALLLSDGAIEGRAHECNSSRFK